MEEDLDYFNDAEANENSGNYFNMSVNFSVPQMKPQVERDLCEPLTPLSLLRSYELQNTNMDIRRFSYIFYPKNFKTYKMQPYYGCVNFHNGHPMASLKPGTVMEGVYRNDVHRTVLESIDIDNGTLTFKDPIYVPYLYYDTLGGDVEKLKVKNALIELNKEWDCENKMLQDIFLKVDMKGRPFSDDEPLTYTQGVVGSGKSYNLVKDVIRHREADGMRTLVVAQNNDALTSLGNEFAANNVRCAQYTNKDLPYSFDKIFEKNDVYLHWKHWVNKCPDTMTEKGIRDAAINAFTTLLSSYVILVTPSRAAVFRTLFKFKNVQFNIYVDEAGLLKFVNFSLLLLYKFKRMWVYGDHKQNAPFEETVREVHPKQVSARIYSRVVMQDGNINLAQWFEDMNVSKTFLAKCRRLPQEDSKVIIPFFYGRFDSIKSMEMWVAGKTPTLKYIESSTVFVPEPLAKYPYMTQKQKNKEASRMTKFLNSVRDNVKDKFQGRFTLAVISPYNHLRNSLQLMWERYYTDLDERWDPSFVTSFTVQGATYDHSFFYCSSAPGKFVTDRTFLVSMSRHKFYLLISPFSVSNILKPGMLALMATLGLIGLKRRRKDRDKTDYRSRLKGKDELIVTVRDEAALIKFFRTKQFEIYLLLVEFYYMKGWQQRNVLNHMPMDKVIVDSFLNEPSKKIYVGGDGEYKYVLAALRKTKYIVDRPEDGKEWLRFDGEWDAELLHSYKVPLGKGNGKWVRPLKPDKYERALGSIF